MPKNTPKKSSRKSKIAKRKITFITVICLCAVAIAAIVAIVIINSHHTEQPEPVIVEEDHEDFDWDAWEENINKLREEAAQENSGN